jgi:hypothetical protein
MSTLMTERRRPLDNDDGQESLFGGEAFAAGPPAPTPWEREHASPGESRREVAAEASAHLPLEEAPAQGPEAPTAFGGAVAPDAVEDERAPVDESQYLTGYEAAPSAEDLAAYDFELPTEVPAHEAGEELAALERATLAPDGARRPRAPLAGPTLDDVMSRAWEGLVTGLPAACPVCDGEVVPSFAGSVHGSCSSCGTTIE